MRLKKIELIVFTMFIFLCFHDSAIGDDNASGLAESRLTGKYYLGDGLGVNKYLSLSSDGTFHFRWQGCLGTYDENEGTYILDKGLIICITLEV